MKITPEKAMERVYLAYVSHNERLNRLRREGKGSSFAAKGHRTRMIALMHTYSLIKSGYPCNRAIAQLFSKGYRIEVNS